MTDVTIINNSLLETIVTDGLLETIVTDVGAENITLVESASIVITGGATANFTHTQSIAAASWTVNHNLGFKPAVKALTLGGVEVLAEVIHTSINQLMIYFDLPLAGQAICS